MPTPSSTNSGKNGFRNKYHCEHHLIADTLQYLEVVPLTLNHYQAAIAQMVALQISGGGIFDALIAQAAIGAQVDALLTLNPKHFTRLGEAIARLVQVPT
jgi:predicted nucleic acid-binding protein